MRRPLGILALLLALTGCGDEPGDVQVDPTPTAPQPAPVLVHATAAGGHVERSATRLPDAAAAREYAARFGAALAADVERAVAGLDVGDGEVAAAQVVAVGCDVPPGASVSGDAIVADEVTAPLEECLAPVTTVAIAAMPAR